MSLIDGFKSLFSSKKINQGIFSFFAPKAIPRMGEKEYIKAYSSWVYACVDAIAERVADIDLVFQQKTKDGTWQTVDTNKTPNEAMDVIAHVNDHMTFYELVFSYAAFQELDGNSFWYLPRKGNSTNGSPTEIWPINPTQMAVVKSKKNFIAGYVMTTETGDQIPFEPEEILHFKHFSSKDPYRGIGTVEAAGIEIDINNFASEWQRNFFGNSAIPASILSSEGTLNQDQYDRVRANWDEHFKGAENAHKLAILEGNLKYTLVQQSNRDLEMTEGKKNTRDNILGIFRVPKTILGITEDVNLASAQATEYIFAKYRIKPKMKEFISKLNEFYLPMFGIDPQKYRLHYVDPVPENLEQLRADRDSGVSHYYMTPNEARAQLGLPPVDGGDYLYVPSLYVPVTDSNVDEGDAPEPADKGQKMAFNRLSVKSKKKDFKIKINRKEVAAKRNSYIQKRIDENIEVINGLNEKLKTIVFDGLKKAKSAKPAQQTSLIKSLYEKITPGADTANLIFQSEAYSGWVKLLFNATQDQMSQTMQEGGTVALAEVAANSVFDLQNPRALDQLTKHALENSNSYSDTMKEDISLEIQQGVEQGLSVDKISANLGQFFDEQLGYRTERLARTETVDAYAQGNLEGYRQSGVVTGKYWLFDDGNCESKECPDNADEGTIPLDDEFESGDDAPPAHPNCECALQPVTKDDISQ